MGSPKVHLAYRRKVTNTETACGNRLATRLTRNPSEVTCERCKASLPMADAEARVEHRRKMRGHKKHTN